MDYTKQQKIFGIVSLDEEGVIVPCEDPQYGNAWFIFRPGNGRMVIYNGEVARTVTREFFFLEGDDVSLFHGFQTVGEFKPEDNGRGLKLIKEYLEELEK